MIQDHPTLPTQPPPLPADLGKPMVPVSGGDRIVLLDMLRGLALLGILIANIPHFSQPLSDYALRPGIILNVGDRMADFISLLLVDDKFRSLFSILFFREFESRRSDNEVGPEESAVGAFGVVVTVRNRVAVR